MELYAASPLCHPLNPRPSPLLLAPSSSRFRPRNLGLRGLRAEASAEDGATVVVKDDVETKRDDVPASSFFATSSEQSSSVVDVREEGETAESLLSQFNIKLEAEETPTYLIYGASALTLLWISSVVLKAIDSIPVFPKLMELVGLGYSVWFTSRYLIFKDTRDEFLAKLTDLKDQIIGSDDD